MSSYEKCGPYVLTEEVQALPYGRIMRAAAVQGFAYLEHLMVLVPSDEARNAGFDRKLDRDYGWFSDMGAVKRIKRLAIFSEDEEPYISMPFVRGRSLRAIVEKNAGGFESCIAAEHVITIAHDMAYGIANIHAAGLAHGALSPDSVWVDIEGSACILDAPLGKVLVECGLQKAMLGPIMEAKQHFGMDFLNDQESFGLVLFYLMTGRAPRRLHLEAEVDALGGHSGERAGSAIATALPERMKRILLRSIQAGYTTPKEMLGDMLEVYRDDSSGYEPTTFDAAFLVQTLFRDEFQREQEEIDKEKHHEYVESVGKPKVVVEEKVVDVENPRRKRIVFVTASILVSLSLLVGGVILGVARRNRAEQARIKNEVSDLLARTRTNEDQFKAFVAEQMERISGAQSAEEKAAILEEIRRRQAAHEAEQVAAQARIEALQKKQKGR